MKFCSGGEKMRNASGHLGKNERRWKNSKNKNTYDISSIKRATRKLLEISHFSRAIKQRQRDEQRKCVARAKFLFC